jgi:hypothetical protein
MHDMKDMPGMKDMAGMHHDGHGDMNEAGMFLMEQASGTSMNPRSWRMPMMMSTTGGWSVMTMAQAFIVDTQQSGPRGRDKLYSTNWGMFSAEHSAGRGSLMIQSMFSLEPATVTDRRYPLLFQTGETAYGRPLVDAQHPHDFFMSVGIHYARPIGESTMFQAYFAPIGDPALGPIAFPHRASAMEMPQATLSHHWQDSTHIASDVATVGALFGNKARIEVSGFHGQEPDEFRWNIDQGGMDSWSSRLTVFPAKNWLAQVSVGRLHHPEALEPGDVVRSTASLHYTRPLGDGDWSSTFAWGRNHKTFGGQDTDSFLAETVLPLGKQNLVTARAEAVDKDELFVDAHGDTHDVPAGVGSAPRIGAFTFGYTRDFALFEHAQTGLGANVTAYTLPDAVKRYYGDRPFGVNIYLRLRLRAAH